MNNSYRRAVPPKRRRRRSAAISFVPPIGYPEKTLGKGTFGKVKLATHIPTG
jgi:hypothetical protein